MYVIVLMFVLTSVELKASLTRKKIFHIRTDENILDIHNSPLCPMKVQKIQAFLNYQTNRLISI